MTDSLSQTPLKAALLAYDAGLSVVPPREDGSKAPLGQWKQYQTERASRDQVLEWYRGPRHGLGLVTGSVSGNLECFEFDDRDTYDLFKVRSIKVGLSELVDLIEAGYCEVTPSGGVHWLVFSSAGVSGNSVLAKRSDTPADKVLIETRGEGGYVITAPSHGRVHPSSRAYSLISGGFSTIATPSAEEHDDLWSMARSFDEMPIPKPSGAGGRGYVRDRPGDDFNRRGNWRDILVPHGWRECFEVDEATHWTRPGKETGTSATTNYGGADLLYVFTSSTAFDSGTAYDKFGALAVLEHDGDFTAAAAALRKEGYGQESFHLTDFGNAERLAALFGDVLKYTPQTGKWWFWDDIRWVPDETGEADRRAKETVRSIVDELS